MATTAPAAAPGYDPEELRILIDPREQDPTRGLDAVLAIVRPLLAVGALIAVPWTYSAIARRLRG